MTKFAVFILTHGRPDNVVTYKTLRRDGYTGDVYIVIDNEDKTAEEYKKRYGDKVIVFDKLKKSKEFDTADLSEDRRAIVYARNACFDIAKDLGLDYFLELDDDYLSFEYRQKKDGKLLTKETRSLDVIFKAFCEFLEKTPAKSIAMAQGGDFIGGAENQRLNEGLLRKCMNSFFCKTDRKFAFLGRVNEDVNTYTCLGQKGELFFTSVQIMLRQKQTQSNAGGMTSLYLDSGTYVKSFYSVIFSPSCVKISMMGDKHKRVHHKVNWNACCPKILNERWKK
jgi:hypothetical protein